MKRLLAIGLLITHASFAQFDMITPAIIKSKGAPLIFTINDFDGDGKKDIAYLSEPDFILTVLYQEADGTFTEAVAYQSSSKSFWGWGLSSGDINKDGKSDIVAFDNGTTSIEKLLVLKSTGRAFEVTKLNAPATSTISNRINLVDWDNDSNLDIMVINIGESLQFYRGNGLGQFAKQVISSIGIGREMEIGHLNNDSQLDVVTIDGKEVSVYISTGNTFTKTIFEVSNFVSDLTIGDLTEDGFNDILLINGNGTTDNLVFLRNSGTGTFTKEFISSPTGLLKGLDIMDFNNDGRQDILAGSFNNEKGVVLLKNIGSRNFIQESVNKNYASLIYQAEFEDLDNDSKPEIIAMSAGGRFDIFKLDILSNQYSLNFTKITGFNAIQGTVGDLNKDGILDLVTSSPSNYAVVVQYGKSDFTYEDPIFFTGSGPITAVGLTDINNDTYPDIIYSSAYTSQSAAGIIKSNGVGGFLPSEQFDPFFGGINMVLSDMNNDGLTDIVNGNSILMAKPGGGYTQKVFSCPIGLSAFIVTDINNDTFKDIVITDFTSVVYFLNNGNGDFPSYATVKNSGTSYKLSVTDLNSDSYPDFIIGSGVPNEVLIYYGNNSGFNIAKLSTSGYRAFNTIAEDFNGDGKPDFAVAHDDGAIDFFIQKEANQFFRTSFKSNGPNFLLVTDLNNDSKKDLITYSANGDPIGILINDTVFEPTLESTNGVISNRTDNSATLSVTKGNGKGRIVIIRESNNSSSVPIDGVFHPFNETIGIGAELGIKNYVIYRGTDQSINVKGLKSDTEYIMSVFEYNSNQLGTIINYTEIGISVQFKTKKTQTISVASIGNKIIGDGPIQLSYSSSSSLPVNVQIKSGNVELSGNLLTLLAPGPVTLNFTQPGNDDFVETEIEVTFCINPLIPTISTSSTGLGQYTLTSSSDINNNWLRNNTLIPEAISKTFQPTKDGIYSVKVDYSGCSNTSLPTAHLITGIEKTHESISLYPNPTSDKLFIEWPKQNPKIDQIMILDAQGKQSAVNYVYNEDGIILNLQDLTSGLFIVRVQTQNGTINRKIIKN